MIVKTTMIFVLVCIFAQNIDHKYFNKPTGVIIWDIKSYYAYLPATFIYQDLSLGFRQENMEKFSDLIWPIETPIGRQAIITTMGMSFLYTPFFFVAHIAALIVPQWEADGYSWPYRFMLTFSALTYVWLGMLYLIKILRRYFGERVIAFTLFCIVLGTNLFYYSTYEAPMSHAFNFALIVVFIRQTMRFYDDPSVKRIVLAGLMAGLITLVRPTNIIVLLLFFLWDIKTVKEFGTRFVYFLGRWYWVAIMAMAFVLVWVPQFVYWYKMAGQVFYFSYGEEGGKFFWYNPQIFNILFSYKKGWLVYTPLMLFALAGIFYLPRRIPGLFLPVLVFTLINIYVLSSWWSWWFGGGFGLRAFVDSYGLLAIPFAGITEYIIRRRKIVTYALATFMLILVFFNQFQTRQYHFGAIHYWWMNKDAYWETFLKLKPTAQYWEIITIPDYEAAREGIYRDIQPNPKKLPQEIQMGKWKGAFSDETLKGWLLEQLKSDTLIVDSIKMLGKDEIHLQQALEEMAEKKFSNSDREELHKEYAMRLIVEELFASPAMIEYIKEKAVANNRTFEDQILIDADWLYYNQ